MSKEEMKTIQLKDKRICVAEVPEGARYMFSKMAWAIMFTDGTDVNLPSGHWQILSLLSELSEEQAKELVEFNGATGFYKAYNSETGYIWNTAIESLHSLFRSHAIDTTKNLLILIEG